MMKKVIIYGTGAQARCCLDTLNYNNNFEVIGFIDDNKEKKKKQIEGLTILGTIEDNIEHFKQNKVLVIIGIGDNKIRKEKYDLCKQKGLNFANAIHPSAIIAKNVQIGTGIFIAAGVIINTGSKIENNIILNTHSSIDHDCIIKNHAQIMPGSTLAGNVTVEELGVVGSGATIIPGKQIGVNSYVGAGAVVTKDVDKNTIVTGIPAKLLKKNDVKKK